MEIVYITLLRVIDYFLGSILMSYICLVGLSTGGVVLLEICVPPVGLCNSSQPGAASCTAYSSTLEAHIDIWF